MYEIALHSLGSRTKKLPINMDSIYFICQFHQFSGINAHYNDGIMSAMASQLPASRLFIQPFRKFRYRNAMIKLRVSSHALEIERGRQCGLSVEERVCRYCHCIEDEKPFSTSLLDCKRSTAFIKYRYLLKILSLYKSEWRTKSVFLVYQSRSSIVILDWQIHILCTATEGLLSRQPIG